MAAEAKLGRPVRRSEEVRNANYLKHDRRPANIDVLENRYVDAKMPQSINELACILRRTAQ